MGLAAVAVALALALFLWQRRLIDSLSAGQPALQGFAPPGREVSGLAFDGQWLWVTVDGAKGIHAVDPRTGHVQRTLPLA